MKVYARQVSPEYQESPLFHYPEEFPDTIALFGNRNYEERIPAFIKETQEVLNSGELLDILEETGTLGDLVPAPKDGEQYPPEYIAAWVDLTHRYFYMEDGNEKPLLCEALELITGNKWDYTTLSGCTQSDWQDAIYQEDAWSLDALRDFEAQYFNTGTEWIIADDECEFDPDNDSPDYISGYSVYCTKWRNEEIREEIASCELCAPEDVVLYFFDGWAKTARYKEVEQ